MAATAALPELSLVEHAAISQNPSAVLIRSRRECGLAGGGYIAALTRDFRRQTSLPNPPGFCLFVVGADLEDDVQIIAPVTEIEWPQLRAKLSLDAAQASLQQFSYLSTMTYEEMMIGGLQCLLDNRDNFEACSFPGKFPYGQGFYCSARRTPLFFSECYQHSVRQFTNNPVANANWSVWCRLIEKAASICERKVREGSINERRHFPFLSKCCAVCGPRIEAVKNCSRCHMISYCSVDHQREDFQVHKKHCKKFKQPGDPL